MPRYAYRCLGECEDAIQVTHGIDDRLEECPACKEAVRKMLTIPISLAAQTAASVTAKPGALVDAYIKEVKEELRQQKKEVRGDIDV